MTRALQERLRLAKIVLSELEKTPLRRTQLEKRTVMHCGTHSTFEGIFRYLKQNSYIEKAGQRYRDPYIITEKGQKFLEGLQ